MQHHRFWNWMLIVLLWSGGLTIGYGLYFRSDAYRRNVRDSLEAFFGLPVDLDGIAPHSLSARELFGLSVWLPDRRARVFHGSRIVWNGSDGSGRVVAAGVYFYRLEAGAYLETRRMSLVK